MAHGDAEVLGRPGRVLEVRHLQQLHHTELRDVALHGAHPPPEEPRLAVVVAERRPIHGVVHEHAKRVVAHRVALAVHAVEAASALRHFRAVAGGGGQALPLPAPAEHLEGGAGLEFTRAEELEEHHICGLVALARQQRHAPQGRVLVDDDARPRARAPPRLDPDADSGGAMGRDGAAAPRPLLDPDAGEGGYLETGGRLAEGPADGGGARRISRGGRTREEGRWCVCVV